MNDKPALVQELFRDSAFISLLNMATRRCLTWEEFLDLPLPSGMSAKQTWDLFNMLSLATGVKSAVPDLDNNWYAYRRTHEITDIVTVISKACSYDSHLYRTVTAAGGRHFFRQLQITEIVASARLDGLFITEKQCNQLLRLDKTPQNAVEQLIVNNLSASSKLEELLDESFSKELFLYFQDLLLKDVNVDELQTIKPAMGLTLFDYPEEKCKEFADRQMEYIGSWANHETADRSEHPAMLAMILCDCFRFYRPLGPLSNQVGNLVTYLYGLKNDLPMFGLLPVSSAKLDWCEGRISPPYVSFDRQTFERQRELSPLDLTSMATIAAQLMLYALRDVEAYVESWEERDVELQVLLKEVEQLNFRQRSILGRALRKSDAKFSIRYHKVNHGIAYPTARRDFVELVERGYLSVHQEGRAFIYRAVPDLDDLIKGK